MLLILLSLGAVYAFIPIIIIIILILAARGAIGADFFGMFGISTLTGAVGGIASGGVGRGLAGQASSKGKPKGYNKKPTALTLNPVPQKTQGSKFTKVKYYGAADIKKQNQQSKIDILNQMEPDEVKRLLMDKGVASAGALSLMGPSELVAYASTELSLTALSSYFARNISSKKPAGQQGSLGAPTPAGMAGMRMSLAQVPSFYSASGKSGRAKYRHYSNMYGSINNSSPEQLRAAILQASKENAARNGTTPSIPPNLDTLDKEALVNLAFSTLSYQQFSKFIGNTSDANAGTNQSGPRVRIKVGDKEIKSYKIPGFKDPEPPKGGWEKNKPAAAASGAAAGGAAASGSGSSTGGATPSSSGGGKPSGSGSGSGSGGSAKPSGDSGSGSSNPTAKMLEQMTPEQLTDMCRHFGMDVPTMTKESMMAFSRSRLTTAQIKEYFENIRGSSN